MDDMPRGVASKVCQQVVKEWSGSPLQDFRLIKARFLKKKEEKDMIEKEFLEIKENYDKLKEIDDIKEKEKLNEFMKIAFEKFNVNNVDRIEEMYKSYVEYTKFDKKTYFEYLKMTLEGEE